MKLRRVKAIAKKEFLHVLRDPWSLGLALAIPAIMLLLFGYALTLDVDHVPLVVWDQSQSAVSRDFIAQYSGSRYFSVRQYVQSYAQVEEQIDSSKALLAMIIPTDFAQKIGAGQSTEVQLIADGSDSNTATIAMGYAEAITQAYSQNLALRQFQRAIGRTEPMPLDDRPRVWFNTDLESRNYIIPGLVAVIMMIIASLMTSLTVAREWERGTMEQLISTPVKTGELIAGKLLPYFLIGMADMVLAVVMGQVLFHVPLRGNVALLFSVASVFLIGVLSMGMLISIAAKNQLVASQMAILTSFVPSYLLSGFIFAIANMPAPIRAFTYAIPARYFVALLKGIYLKGVGLDFLFLDAALMVAFGVVTVMLAKMKFKKKLAG